MSQSFSLSRTPEANAISATLKRCLNADRRSRAEIADALSKKIGYTVTERQVNNWTAESREDYRLPLELVVPLCESLGDWSLLEEQARRVGLRLIGHEEERLITIGRAFVMRAEAQAVLRQAGRPTKSSGRGK